VKTLYLDYYVIISRLFNLSIELLLPSSCSTSIDGMQAHRKDEHGW
jgi:hypothetical protein